MKLFLSARRPASLALITTALSATTALGNPPPTTADYAVHEWGTFTSVQDSTGRTTPWNPFTTSDLPSFVFQLQIPTRNLDTLCSRAGHFRTLASKTSRPWLQRMETPVLYFYSEQGAQVSVRVDFPDGTLSEWFPQVSGFGPVQGIPDVLPSSDQSHLRWEHVRILGRAESERVLTTASALPTEPGSSHYYAARETEAQLVEVTHPFAREAQPQRDRFLFYRGAGDFEAPLWVGRPQPGVVHVVNRGTEPLGPFFVVRNQDGHLAFTRGESLTPGAGRTVPLPTPHSVTSAAASADSLASQLTSDLRSAGLHHAEAAAMVKTWRDAWFHDPGVRVLYLLPSAWSDRLLPLQLDPPPRQQVRVFVGRAESLDADTEARVRFQLLRTLSHAEPVEAQEWWSLGLGRFTPAALAVAARQLKEHAGSLSLTGAGPAATLTMNLLPAAWTATDSEAQRQRIAQISAVLEGSLATSDPNRAAHHP